MGVKQEIHSVQKVFWPTPQHRPRHITPVRARPRWWIAVWLLLAVNGLAAEDATAAAPLTARYRVHVGGIAVLDATVRLDLTDRAYRIDVTAENGGFLAKILPWKTDSHSEGVRESGGLRPLRHRQSSVFREKPRSVALDYAADGALTATVLPPPQEDDRAPVPPDLQRGALDPLSAGLLALLAVGDGNACARTVLVFDGRRRYDLRFDPGGMRPLAASRYSIFSGVAQECRLSVIPIAGQAKSSSALTAFWRRDDDPSPRPAGPPTDLWLAPLLPGAPPLPVRMESDSAFGAVVIHLIGLTREGDPPRAIP